MSLSGIWKSSRTQFITLFVIWLIAGIFILIYGKTDITLFLNKFHSGFLDEFFKYWTWLGSGWVALGLILFIILFVNLCLGLLLTIANVATGLVVQGLKLFVFEDVVRPVAALKNLHLVQGVDMHFYNSFPSGHTATAFALFFGLSLMMESKPAKWLFFVVAVLIGYSRLYLSQHFLTDVLGGSITGTVLLLLTLWLFSEKWQKLDGSSLTLIKKK
ncbi:MAG: phosphatase PAP2 family protein [Bacteroidales bacterium]|nr:phosphatase PAP2 family protein [Bacteroidales bacterium]